MLPRLPCPNPACNVPDRVKQKEWNSKGVRTVRGDTQDWDLISMRYECKACGITFCASEKKSLDTLPEWISEQFPAVLTKKKGYLVELSERMARCATMGMSMHGINEELREAAAEKYARRERLYYKFMLAFREYARKVEAEGSQYNAKVQLPELTPFGPMLKPEGTKKELSTLPQSYCLTPLSSNYVSTMVLRVHEERKEMMRLDMQAVTGDMMKGDHTFDPAKTCRVDGRHPFNAVYTVMNGEGLIASQHFVETKSPSETEPILRNIKARVEKLGGGQPVSIWYTDMCCQEAGSLCRVFGSELKIRLDPFHMLQRFRRAISLKHSQAADFMKALSAALFVVPADQLPALQQSINEAVANGGNLGGLHVTRATRAREIHVHIARKFVPVAIPDPDTLSAAVGAVINAYSESTSSDGSIVTSHVLRVWQNQQVHIRNGCLTDPLPVAMMYRKMKKYWKSCRGTSQIESYHARKNRALSSTHCSPDLILALLALYNHRFNGKIKVGLGQQEALGHYHYTLALDCNRLAAELGLPLPYPNLVVNQVDTGEYFGQQNSPATEEVIRKLYGERTVFYEEPSESSDDGEDDLDSDWSSDEEDDDDDDSPLTPQPAPVPYRSNKRPRASETLGNLQGSALAVKQFSTPMEHHIFMFLWQKHEEDLEAMLDEFNELAISSVTPAKAPSTHLFIYS